MSPPTLALAATLPSDGLTDWLTLPTVSAGSMVMLILIGFMSGRVQPRSNLEREERSSNAWRAAYEKSEAARVAQAEQLREVLDGSRAVLDLLRGMEAAAATRTRDRR